MRYLDYVYNMLALSNSVGIQTTKNKRRDFSISIKKINKTTIIAYIAFCSFIVLFLCLIFAKKDIGDTKQQTLDFNIMGKAIIISIIVFIACTTIGLIKRYIILKTKESKPSNINIYNRELPAHLTPAHARLLVEDGLIDKQTLASTILDLIDKGYLSLESENRNDIFSKDLYITITNKPQDDLFEYEKYIINWFFNTNRISSKELHERLNNEEENPCEKFEIFQGLVLVSFPINKYYKKCKASEKIITFIILIITFLPLIFMTEQAKSFVTLGICESIIILAFANLFFATPTYLLNDAGAELRDSYLDLKRFLLDFSLIQDKTSEMIRLWNYYLSYSIALGIEGIANDEIKEFFGNEIYNQNSTMINNEDASVQMYIDNTNNIINQSEELYKRR